RCVSRTLHRRTPMQRPKTCARSSALGRRDFLQASAALGGVAALSGLAVPGIAYEAPRHLLARDIPPMPGRFPGRVVEVQDPAAVPMGVPDRGAVRRMVARGMAELTGIAEPVEAWRSMFEPGDVVGIKVNPVGNPNAISNYATIHAIVEGLE